MQGGGGVLGRGVYFDGQWSVVPWPDQWAETEKLREITYQEMIPIVLAIYLWKQNFKGKRIQFSSVVSILSMKKSTSPIIMVLVREIVILSLMYDFHINAIHVRSSKNGIADTSSRKQWQRFKCMAPRADLQPTLHVVPTEFWNLLAAR